MSHPFWINQIRRSRWVIAPTLWAVFVFINQDAYAQTIREDTTLGSESSSIIRGRTIRGVVSDRIEGGARRGANLFHSFEQFDIPANRGAYFNNPVGIENIFGRVTGRDTSDISGTLGVIREGSTTLRGTANLFLMNPNGILFGPTARLDVGGSFAATTANAIQFGEQGLFNATQPNTPPALTVNPSAFLFSQIATGNIVNRSVAPNTSGSTFLVGLRVPDGENLLLLGGNVVVDGGRLSAFGGRIDIGAVSGIGTVPFNADGSLSVADDLMRADVSFTNNAVVDVAFGYRG